jgi:radical SAM protein with 4Fe4S-binding SPASM domain
VGITEAAIAPEGDVRPCIHTDRVAGNILTDGWNRCWKALETWTSSDILPSDCLGCEAVDHCGGGCRMAALDKYGDICAKDPYMAEPLVESGQLVKSKTDHPIPDDDDRIVKSSGFVLRKEAFGGAVFAYKRYMFLKPEPFAFLQEISTRESFSISDLASEFLVDIPELREFIGNLVDRGFLVLKERR